MPTKRKAAYKSIRKGWEINPKTRVKPSDKVYNRQLSKKEVKRILEQEDL